MSIAVENRGGYFINTPSPDETPETAMDQIADMFDEWIKHPVIWDLRQNDFTKVHIPDINNFTLRTLSFGDMRAGLKTAVVCADDLAFGSMRMSQAKLEDEMQLLFKVFRDMDEAIAWIEEP